MNLQLLWVHKYNISTYICNIQTFFFNKIIIIPMSRQYHKQESPLKYYIIDVTNLMYPYSVCTLLSWSGDYFYYGIFLNYFANISL